jgi:hypothetical protein
LFAPANAGVPAAPLLCGAAFDFEFPQAEKETSARLATIT